MTRKKGFTLIELLVVIAIISLLLSIIVPSLKMAKRKAATASCLTNVKNLTLAWYSYQGENNGRFMSADPTATEAQAPWVRHPIREDGTPCLPTATTPPVTDDDEKRGIARGKMYEYGVDNFDTYHCPGDTYRKSKYDGTTIFRSYALPSALGKGVSRFHQITSPSTRYTFVEEGEGRNFNFGSWEFYAPWDSVNEYKRWYWRDPISINHGNSGVLGFCDGHAEVHIWQDSDTKARLEFYFSNPSIQDYGFGGGSALNSNFIPTPGQNNDTEYMGRGWAVQSPTRK